MFFGYFDKRGIEPFPLSGCYALGCNYSGLCVVLNSVPSFGEVSEGILVWAGLVL